MPKKVMNYSNACVYKICCRDLEVTDVYVGSTTSLAKRRYQHKSTCHNENSKDYNLLVYRFIRDHGGFDNWTVTKVQEATVTCSEDLLQLERACMERLGATLNKNVPGNCVGKSVQEYYKDYYEERKTEIIEKVKQYNEAHKTEIAERGKQYRELNKTKIFEYKKNYYEAHKTEIAEKAKQYREAHRTELAEKVTCQCGAVVCKSYMSRHCKTKKHQKYLRSLE